MKKVITSTGRCGTSFLMQLLTNCGLNTGYTPEEAEHEINRIDGLNAGIEHSITGPKIAKAEWIKNPKWFAVGDLKVLLDRFQIETIFVPVRNLRSTALSRKNCSENVHAEYGGYWMGARDERSQMCVNAELFYDFIQFCLAESISYVLIDFDRMMNDGLYLYEKLELSNYVGFEGFLNNYLDLVDHKKIRF